MSDETIRWFDDEPDVPTPSRRTRWLLVAAVAPWLVVVLVLVRSGSASPTQVAPAAIGGGPTAASAGGADDEHRADDDGGDGANGDTDRAVVEPQGSLLDEPASGASQDGHGATDLVTSRVAYGVAEALAVAVTRAWLSDAGPDLPAPGIDVRRGAYLEHVVVERIDLVDPQLAVATVSVVLLERDGDVYGAATLRRVAVPLTVTPSTVHAGGTPWWLATALDLTPVPPETGVNDDPAAPDAAVDALTAAGYRDVTVAGLAVTSTGVVVAEVTATTEAGDRIDGPVWLRSSADGLELLGHHRDDRT
ncbi:MAG: hypothetical protein WEB03_02015 [Nitriliruptor sp.]|uniref:hypothetical protein n=1 Tax=Nitriliruptor sp. TaxID=2448056 RepID=UPI0034A016FB